MRFGFAAVIPVVAIILFCQPATTSAAADRSISGSVFFDTNKNGQFDFGEAPAPGRTVEFVRSDPSWQTVGKVKSDAKGYYSFDHVPFDVSSLYVGVRPDEQTGCVTGDTQPFNNENGDMFRGKTATPGSIIDLGVLARGTGAATGTFTNDLNENGLHDRGEPPLKGWKLIAFSSPTPNLNCYSEATSGSDGAFRLPLDLGGFNLFWLYPPTSVDLPWEWTAPTWPSTNPLFPGQRVAPNGVAKGMKLDVMIHFSTGSASLSGTVFLDLDGDGAHDPTEPFLDCDYIDRILRLSHMLAGVGAIEVNAAPTCMTDGRFKFSRLEGGDYRLEMVAGFRLNEIYYDPSAGARTTIRDGQHAESPVVALEPRRPKSTPVPTALPRPFATRSPDTTIIMPPAGSQTDESNYVSAALMLATMGFASIFAAVLLHAYRARRN